MLKRLFASKNKPFIRNLDKLDRLRYDLSGSILEISLPPNDSEIGARNLGDKFNVFDKDSYQAYERRGENEPTNELKICPIMSRSWDMLGNILKEPRIGSIDCAITLLDVSQLGRSINCFNAKHFEFLVEYDLYFSFGPGGGSNRYICPINWKHQILGEAHSQYVEAWRQNSPEAFNPRHKSQFKAFLYIPISEKHLVQIAFSIIGSLPFEPSNQKALEFIRIIADTISVKYSQEANKMKIENETRHPIGNNFRKPKNWNYHTYRDGDATKDEPSKVLVKLGSPPPTLPAD